MGWYKSCEIEKERDAERKKRTNLRKHTSKQNVLKSAGRAAPNLSVTCSGKPKPLVASAYETRKSIESHLQA